MKDKAYNSNSEHLKIYIFSQFSGQLNPLSPPTPTGQANTSRQWSTSFKTELNQLCLLGCLTTPQGTCANSPSLLLPLVNCCPPSGTSGQGQTDTVGYQTAAAVGNLHSSQTLLPLHHLGGLILRILIGENIKDDFLAHYLNVKYNDCAESCFYSNN